MSHSFSHRWTVNKPALQSAQGIVVSQNRRASEVGAKVLCEGGNAVDAAIATSFALGATEPWMSGIGGGGYMLVQNAPGETPTVFDFGMRSPSGIAPENYPLSGQPCQDLFPWPGVVEDRNVLGATAVALPGTVAGMASAHERFGSKRWRDLLQPSVSLAQEGLPIDWYAQLMMSAVAPELARFPASKSTFLTEQGYPLSATWTAHTETRCHLGALAKTLQHLADFGAESFYRGPLAESMVRDLRAAGGCHELADFANYQASEATASRLAYRDHQVYGTPEMTAGPTLAHAMTWLAQRWQPQSTQPSAEDFIAYARALRVATQARLSSMGDTPEARPSCTSHFNVVDSSGMMVSCTQTLLSIFGSRLMLPESGILMNNGMLWFDPEPGKPNSLGPNKRCLANMCPTLLAHSNGRRIALGASGGRKILPSVLQLSSFLLDFNMSLNDAIHAPRIDTSLADITIVDEQFSEAMTQQLQQALGAIQSAPRTVYPYHFACPSAVSRQSSLNTGVTEVMSPWADAVCAPL